MVTEQSSFLTVGGKEERGRNVANGSFTRKPSKIRATFFPVADDVCKGVNEFVSHTLQEDIWIDIG